MGFFLTSSAPEKGDPTTVKRVPVIKSVEAKTRHQKFPWKSGRATSVRQGNWKLMMSGEKTDLSNDLDEANNLATRNPEVVADSVKTSSRD